jgi:flagellar motor switch protein FliG
MADDRFPAGENGSSINTRTKTMSHTATITNHSAAARKSAILIATLDAATADQLLSRMPREAADQVRRAMKDLDDVPDEEQDDVIQEFLRADAAGDRGDAGVELDEQLALKLRSPEGYERAAGGVDETPASRPFQALCDASPEAVAHHLSRQHPQAIALVVAHLPPSFAAAVVDRLIPRLQADVLRRVSELDSADADVIRDVERTLEQLLSGEIRATRNRSAGLSTVAAIVHAAGASGPGLLDNLQRHQQEFAGKLGQLVEHVPRQVPASRRAQTAREEPDGSAWSRREQELRGTTSRAALPSRPPAAPTDDAPSQPPEPVCREHAEPVGAATAQTSAAFDRLAVLADDDWATLLREVDHTVALLALAGASETLIARVVQHLPGHEAREFRRRLERVGPVQLADLDRAQQQMVQRASELTRQGKLVAREWLADA